MEVQADVPVLCPPSPLQITGSEGILLAWLAVVSPRSSPVASQLSLLVLPALGRLAVINSKKLLVW